MGTLENWWKARVRINEKRLAEAVALARRAEKTWERAQREAERGMRLRREAMRPDEPRPAEAGFAQVEGMPPESEKGLVELAQAVPESWPAVRQARWPDHVGFAKLLEEMRRSDPNHPLNWHKRLVDEQLAKPQTRETYFKIRRALWEWEELAGVRRGARAILESVIELARDEAFPWHLNVPAHEVRRVARLAEGSFARSVRELQCLAVTRPARMVKLCTPPDLMPRWPGKVDLNEEAKPMAQWVVLYRQGIPWNKKAAAWWINYDLLTGTGRVMPMFVVGMRTLAKTYLERNGQMGGRLPDPMWALTGEPTGFAVAERNWAQSGPLPPAGLRATLWTPVVE